MQRRAGQQSRGRGKEGGRERESFPSVSHARSTSAGGRGAPGAVLQAPAPSDALHGVAAETRVHRHVPELEHRPPHHPVGHVEGGATGHPCTTAQMERPGGYISVCPAGVQGCRGTPRTGGGIQSKQECELHLILPTETILQIRINTQHTGGLTACGNAKRKGEEKDHRWVGGMLPWQQRKRVQGHVLGSR